MSQLTTLTPAAVRAVLHGLSTGHSSGTSAELARAGAVDAMASALTQPRPVDPELALLRTLLAESLGHDPTDAAPADDSLVQDVRDTIALTATLGGERDRYRDQLTALLDLDPDATDETITETATARAAQRALGRSAEKTAALTTPASGRLDRRLLAALGWSGNDHPEAHIDRALDQVAELAADRVRRAGQLADALGGVPGGWQDLLDLARAAARYMAAEASEADERQRQLADALGVPTPSGGWPELLDRARALAKTWTFGDSDSHEAGLQRAANRYGEGRVGLTWDCVTAEAEAVVRAYLDQSDPT